MSYYFRAKIVETNPIIRKECEYEDVNEQIVVVQLPDGKLIGLFNTLPISQDMIGQTKNISIVVGPKMGGIKIVNDLNPGIEPSHDNSRGYRDHKYFGIVREVGVKDVWHPVVGYPYLVSICVGPINVLIEFDKELFSIIREGDKIEVIGAMSNLLDVL